MALLGFLVFAMPLNLHSFSSRSLETLLHARQLGIFSTVGFSFWSGAHFFDMMLYFLLSIFIIFIIVTMAAQLSADLRTVGMPQLNAASLISLVVALQAGLEDQSSDSELAKYF